MYSWEVSDYLKGLDEGMRELADDLYLKLQLLRLAGLYPVFVGIAVTVVMLLIGAVVGSPGGFGVVFAVAAWTGVAVGGWLRLSRRYESICSRHLNEVAKMLFAHPELHPVARELARLDPAVAERAKAILPIA